MGVARGTHVEESKYFFLLYVREEATVGINAWGKSQSRLEWTGFS